MTVIECCTVTADLTIDDNKGLKFVILGQLSSREAISPSIVYCELNNIIIKNKYPLPLIDNEFGPLHEASIFSKLDLSNAYI